MKSRERINLGGGREINLAAKIYFGLRAAYSPAATTSRTVFPLNASAQSELESAGSRSSGCKGDFRMLFLY